MEKTLKMGSLSRLYALSISRLLIIAVAFIMLLVSALPSTFAQDVFDITDDTEQPAVIEKQSASRSSSRNNISVSRPLDGAISTVGRNGQAVRQDNATIRLAELARVEVLLNSIATGLEFLFVGLGLAMVIVALVRLINSQNGSAPDETCPLLLWGAALVVLGLAIPGTLNWFVASARDMSYFS